MEPLFWEHTSRDIPEYYHFILGLKRRREYTEIWLGLSEQNRIEGMMLIYRNSTVQLRGSVEAASGLLEKLNLGKLQIQGPVEHWALIPSRYKNIRKASEIILMTLKKGEEHLQKEHPTVSLSTEDAGEIVPLMRRGNPDWWGETTEEQISTRMNERLWLGIKVDGKLVSVGGATVERWASNIAPVVTHEGHRNRGYATSVVSALVEQILQKSDISLIHVESDNGPAMRVYTKVGFKPHNRYFQVRAEK